MLQPFNDASNSLGTQSDGRQGGNFFGTHSLPEVEPENHTVALLVGPVHATLQVFIDLITKNFESDSSLAPMSLPPSLGVNICRGNVRYVTAGRLTMAMLEMVLSGIGGSPL
jgi:hypothetical protein